MTLFLLDLFIMFCLLPQLLFYHLTSNLLPPLTLLSPPCSSFFPISHSNLHHQKSHFTLLLVHPLFISHSLHRPPPSQHPDCGLVWPFNVSLCFSVPLTPPILSLSFRLQLMPSSVCSLLEPNFQSQCFLSPTPASTHSQT